MTNTVYTIGHSSHTEQRFCELLSLHAITAVADVRSRPYSRYNPQFDREPLQESLRPRNIRYVFFGDSLGARSDIPSCYHNGKVSYDRLARTQPFQDGLARIEKGITQYRIALMCAEKEPLDCHRSILVARYLALRGIEIQHIHEDGHLETQSGLITRLASLLHLRVEEQHLFRTPQDLIDDIYSLQEKRIAYEMEAAPDVSAA